MENSPDNKPDSDEDPEDIVKFLKHLQEERSKVQEEINAIVELNNDYAVRARLPEKRTRMEELNRHMKEKVGQLLDQLGISV